MQMVRRPSPNRDTHAIKLRDVAMQVMHAHQTLSYRDDFLVIEFRPQVGDRPCGLDVWQRDDRSTKTLCIIWSDTDSVVISYRSGAWEQALHRAAARADALT
jgi:hypothetical protein